MVPLRITVFALIHEAVNHWSEWVLLGTRSTADWGKNMWDITNAYVKQIGRYRVDSYP